MIVSTLDGGVSLLLAISISYFVMCRYSFHTSSGRAFSICVCMGMAVHIGISAYVKLLDIESNRLPMYVWMAFICRFYWDWASVRVCNDGMQRVFERVLCAILKFVDWVCLPACRMRVRWSRLKFVYLPGGQQFQKVANVYDIFLWHFFVFLVEMHHFEEPIIRNSHTNTNGKVVRCVTPFMTVGCKWRLTYSCMPVCVCVCCVCVDGCVRMHMWS